MSRSYLNEIWKYRGVRQLKTEFKRAVRYNRKRALGLINEEGLSFPVLYVLIPEIKELSLSDSLNDRNTEAVRFCGELLGGGEIPDLPLPALACLSWIFNTGHLWDGTPGTRSYMTVIDYTAARLIIDYGRADILPRLADLIFRRHRRGYNIHDLVWIFFQSFNPDAMAEIAGFLLSRDSRDAELARKMLHLQKLPANGGEKKRMHDEYIEWLYENCPYLYLSGEYFNMSSEPEAVKCDLEAKYLQREIDVLTAAPKEPLPDSEALCLAVFRRASSQERELLAGYSSKLHKADIHAWHEWIEMDIAVQVSCAAAATGEFY